MSQDAPAWQTIGRASLQPLVWDDDAVVYNPCSGDTHRLNLVERTALDGIARRPGATLDDLVPFVSAQLDLDEIDSLRDYLSRLLDQLDELGLIEPVSRTGSVCL